MRRGTCPASRGSPPPSSRTAGVSHIGRPRPIPLRSPILASLQLVPATKTSDTHPKMVGQLAVQGSRLQTPGPPSAAVEDCTTRVNRVPGPDPTPEGTHYCARPHGHDLGVLAAHTHRTSLMSFFGGPFLFPINCNAIEWRILPIHHQFQPRRSSTSTPTPTRRTRCRTCCHHPRRLRPAWPAWASATTTTSCAWLKWLSPF